MYILSIFVTEQALSEDNILTYLMEFPMHQKEGYLQYTEKDIRNKLQNSLHALYQQNFIRHELFSKRYIISDLGKAIRGYIFDITKFSELWTTIAKDEIYTFDFSYSITNCLPDKDINAFIPNKKKYADNIMSLHIATELYFETWINKKIISKQMAEKIKNIFYTGYRNEKQIWHLKQCQDSSRLFPVIRIATMVTMHLEGYSMREIYQITNTAVGINTSTMTKIAYFAEITSHLSSYKNDILKSNKIKSISTALYYGGMPYKMISMLDNTSLSANDKETLFFINRYFNMKTKKNKTQFDKIKIENMKQRMHKLPEKYSHIIKNLEINND